MMNDQLLSRLQALRRLDLDTRNQLLAAGRLYGTYDQAMRDIHIANAEALQAIIEEHGWPGISLVGLEGCRAAWLIAQHSICTPNLQRGFLRRLESAVSTGEAPAKLAAMLHDRICFNEGKPQVYGTVLDWDEQGFFGCQLENRNRVDTLREAVGLPPYEESRLAHLREVEVEGGRAAPDYAAYQVEFLSWVKNTGWR